MIRKLVLHALLNKHIQILDLTQPWDLLRSHLRALTQTYIMVAKFQSVFSRLVQVGSSRRHTKIELVGLY